MSCRALLFLCTFAALASAATDEELRQAVIDGDQDQDTVQELIASGRVNVSDVRGEDEETLLHNASIDGHAKIVELLLAAWPDGVQAVNKRGNTPLHFAALGGHAKIAELLLATWPDGVQAGNKRGNTPLHFAAGRSNLAELLLAAWPDGTQAVDENGATPLHWAPRAR